MQGDKILKNEFPAKDIRKENAWEYINELTEKGSFDKERLYLVGLMARAGQGLCPMCGSEIEEPVSGVSPFNPGRAVYEYYWRCPRCGRESKRYLLRAEDELIITKDYLKMDFFVSLINECLSKTDQAFRIFP